MKKLKDNIDTDQTDDNIINVIANSINRASVQQDTRGLLLLIAALGLLNLSKDGLPASVARKLATASSRNWRSKDVPKD